MCDAKRAVRSGGTNKNQSDWHVCVNAWAGKQARQSVTRTRRKKMCNTKRAVQSGATNTKQGGWHVYINAWGGKQTRRSVTRTKRKKMCNTKRAVQSGATNTKQSSGHVLKQRAVASTRAQFLGSGGAAREGAHGE